MIVDTYAVKAPFFDVDSCHVVWHGHYVKYFEEARCALLDRIGYNYQKMREDGYVFPVVDLQIKYVKPLVFAQEFVVESTLVEWQNRLKIKYVIRDSGSNEKITKGHTVQVAVEIATGVMQFDCPQSMIEKVEAML